MICKLPIIKSCVKSKWHDSSSSSYAISYSLVTNLYHFSSHVSSSSNLWLMDLPTNKKGLLIKAEYSGGKLFAAICSANSLTRSLIGSCFQDWLKVIWIFSLSNFFLIFTWVFNKVIFFFFFLEILICSLSMSEIDWCSSSDVIRCSSKSLSFSTCALWRSACLCVCTWISKLISPLFSSFLIFQLSNCRLCWRGT